MSRRTRLRRATQSINTRVFPKITSSEAIGPELITNGGFGADTNWTKGTGWTISGGVAVGVGVIAGPTGYLQQSVNLASGKIYIVTYTISGFSAGGISWVLVNNSQAGTVRAANGTYTEYIHPTVNITAFGFARRNNDFTGNLDNVSVRQIGG